MTIAKLYSGINTEVVDGAGRTGRAGSTGRATSFYTDRDSFLVSQIKRAIQVSPSLFQTAVITSHMTPGDPPPSPSGHAFSCTQQIPPAYPPAPTGM